MIEKYIGKRSQKCDMCKEMMYNSRYFTWIGQITRIKVEVCLKCAQREIGSHKKQKLKLRKMYE